MKEFLKLYGTDGASLIIAQIILLAETNAHEDSDLIIEAKAMNKRLLNALRELEAK